MFGSRHSLIGALVMAACGAAIGPSAFEPIPGVGRRSRPIRKTMAERQKARSERRRAKADRRKHLARLAR